MTDAKLTDKGAGAIKAADLRMPTGITMDPAGIDLFTFILHIVYAHQANPEKVKLNASKLTFHRHFKNAHDYLKNSGIETRVEWKCAPHHGEDRETYVYTLQHPLRGDNVTIIAVDPCQPEDHCLFVFSNEKFIHLDLGKIHLLDPA